MTFEERGMMSHLYVLTFPSLDGEGGGLTSSSHMLAGPDWLEADERDLHRQYETHNVESAVSCKRDTGRERDRKQMR